MVGSPDAKYVVVTHLVGQFKRPIGHLAMDWINANALTLLDLDRLEVLGSVLLDDRGRGAANPWGAAFSPDGKMLVVAHSGTHEVSLIDFPDLVARILDLPAPAYGAAPATPYSVSQEQMDMGNYLPFFPAKRVRLELPKGDYGPREVAIVGHTAYVTNYFSDTVTAIDFSDPKPKIHSVPISTRRAGELSLARKGEFYFHDAGICYQGWQTCASCHPEGRADGLNWDLLNDGSGNPKNTKSLLLAHQTPPAMSLGVRPTAEAAVRAGIEHILFTRQPESVAAAIDAYLRSLKPVPSPYLVDGKLSPAAQAGKAVFERAGCATCHPAGLFTDQKQHDIGTRGPKDKPTDKFDTPTLIELWRTAPYLHDGSAATVRDVVTMRNPENKHGRTSDLSARDIDALCAYLLSL